MNLTLVAFHFFLTDVSVDSPRLQRLVELLEASSAAITQGVYLLRTDADAAIIYQTRVALSQLGLSHALVPFDPEQTPTYQLVSILPGCAEKLDEWGIGAPPNSQVA